MATVKTYKRRANCHKCDSQKRKLKSDTVSFFIYPLLAHPAKGGRERDVIPAQKRCMGSLINIRKCFLD